MVGGWTIRFKLQAMAREPRDGLELAYHLPAFMEDTFSERIDFNLGMGTRDGRSFPKVQ
jgi:hypothetical protein